MSKGKYSRKRGMNLRPLILVLTVALLLGATIGGTIAWLTATTQKVENTFTVGNVAIKLEETEIIWDDATGEYSYGQVKDATNTAVQNQYKMIPGETYKKDPIVTVNAKSEDCWLFVRFEKGENTDTYITYQTLLKSPEWTKLDNAGGQGEVWYREVDYSTDAQTFPLLAGKDAEGDVDYTKGYITVNPNTVTKTTMEEAVANSSLKFTAYAVQRDNLTVAEAWAQVSGT